MLKGKDNLRGEKTPDETLYIEGAGYEYFLKCDSPNKY